MSLIRSNTDGINWYRSSPIITVDVFSICSSTTGFTLIQCLYPPHQNCCIIYTKQCGLFSVCFGSDRQQSFTADNLKLSISVQSMLIQYETTNFWIADIDFIYLYDISASISHSRTILLAKIVKDPSMKSTLSFKYLQNIQGRLFITGIGGVFIYNISTPNQPLLIQSIPSKQGLGAQSITTTPSIGMLFIADGSLRILKISNPADILNPSSPINIQNQMCSFPFSFVSINEIVNDRYLLVQSSSSLVGGVDLTTFLASGNCSDLQFQILFSNSDSISQVYLSPDSRYIMVYLIGIHLSIIEITYQPVLSSKLFQRIPITGNHQFYFQVTSDQKFIIISSQYTLTIFQRKDQINYNSIAPSILNIPQMIVALQDTVISAVPLQPYGCQFTPINNYLVYTKGLLGTYILQEDKDSHFLNLLQDVNPPNFASTLRMSKVFNQEKTLIIGRGSIIYIYNISNISNPPVLLSTTNFGFQGIQIREAYITKDMKYVLLAADAQGVIVADISDLTAPKFISKIYHDLPIASNCYSVSMPSSEKYAIGSYYNQGLVIYDFSDFLNPTVVSYFTTYSGGTHLFMKNENFLIKSDLVYGIVIVNLSDIKNPVEYSSLHADAAAKYCVLIRDDQFLLCTSKSLGQLKLIDLRDLKNPYMLQKYNYNTIFGGYNVCVNNDESILYLGLLGVIIRVNLYPSLRFETDIRLLAEGSTLKDKFLDPTSTLLVGMQIQVFLTQVYPINQAYITGVQFYSNFELQDLPFWASYSVVDSSLIIRFDKNSLLSSRNSQCVQSLQSSTSSSSSSSCSNTLVEDVNTMFTFQFVFLISQQLDKESFINSNLGIDSTLSNQIFKDCILANLINHQYYFVKSTFEVTNYLLSTKYPSQALLQFIYYVLSQHNTNYPVILKLQQSMVINFDENNKIPSIDSIINYVYVQLQIDNSLHAQFIPYSYSGDVLVYLSDTRDWMKLEGSLSSINTILQRGVKIANFTNAENILITVSIDDTVNFPVTKSIKGSHKQLIQLNQPVQNNPNHNLQQDFDKQYPGGSIYILSTFSFTLNSIIFLNPDNRAIKYEAKFLQSDGLYLPIPQQFWLLFQKEEGTFVGTTESNQYGQTIRILLNATDGYTYAIDYLEININLVPVSYILLLVFQIISPIIGLLGLWKYRCSFYNFTQKDRFVTTRIQFFSESQIILQIPLLGNKLQIAQQLWSEYSKKINKKAVISEYNEGRIGKQMNFNNSSNTEMAYNDATMQGSYFISKMFPLEKDKEVTSTNSRLKNQQKFQNHLIKNLKKKSTNNSQFLPQLQGIELKQQESKEQDDLKYFNPNYTVNSSKIMRDIIEQYKQKHKMPDQRLIDQLSNPLSMLSRAITGLATISFAQQLDKSIEKVIKYLQIVAKQEGFKETDWYKYYAEIIPQCSRIHIDQFPLIKIEEETLLKVLRDPLSNVGQKETNHEFKQKLPLIKEVIAAYALGFTLDEKGIVPKIRGECIEIKPHNIQSIKTFRPQHSKFCIKRGRKQKETLVAKEFSCIQEMPSWVQSVDLVNKVILIKGQTEYKDIGEYILNIYDNQQFIIKQIRICITAAKSDETNPLIELSPIQLNNKEDNVLESIQNNKTEQVKLTQKYTEEEVPFESQLIDNRYFDKSQYSQKSNLRQLNTLLSDGTTPFIFNSDPQPLFKLFSSQQQQQQEQEE